MVYQTKMNKHKFNCSLGQTDKSVTAEHSVTQADHRITLVRSNQIRIDSLILPFQTLHGTNRNTQKYKQYQQKERSNHRPKKTWIQIF